MVTVVERAEERTARPVEDGGGRAGRRVTIELAWVQADVQYRGVADTNNGGLEGVGNGEEAFHGKDQFDPSEATGVRLELESGLCATATDGDPSSELGQERMSRRGGQPSGATTRR